MGVNGGDAGAGERNRGNCIVAPRELDDNDAGLPRWIGDSDAQ